MRRRHWAPVSAGLGVAVGLAAGAALAQDMNDNFRDSVGLPLKPADAAANTWTLESHGRSVCHLGLMAEAAAKDLYRVVIPAECGPVLPAGVAGWRPVTDGAALIDGQGQILIDFNRWSPSLLVSHGSSGRDLQLRRDG